MNIKEIIQRATLQATTSGFTTPGKPRSVAEHVALIHTEVSELYEAHRDGFTPAEHLYKFPGSAGLSKEPYSDEGERGKPEGIPSELADIIIRVCNMAGEYSIDLEQALHDKMFYNATRPHMHGRIA